MADAVGFGDRVHVICERTGIIGSSNHHQSQGGDCDFERGRDGNDATHADRDRLADGLSVRAQGKDGDGNIRA